MRVEPLGSRVADPRRMALRLLLVRRQSPLLWLMAGRTGRRKFGQSFAAERNR